MGTLYKLRIAGKYTGRQWRIYAEKIKETDQVVQFRIYGRDRSVVLQSTYPLLRARKLTRRKITWKMVHGHMYNISFLECVGEALTRLLRRENGEESENGNLYRFA
jgi:hypothetical protein